MLFIKQLLSTAGLLNGQAGEYSIACVSTSRPIYLVFNKKPDYPEYVVRRLDDTHAIHCNRVHNELYCLVGNLVPEPIGVYEHAGNKFDVQRGVKGAPWFQIQSRIRTAEARATLERRAWQTLNNFQAIVSDKYKQEIDQIQPHKELLHAYSEYQGIENSVNTELEKLVEFAANDLSNSPNCRSVPQHGDFCLNNLIIDKNHITVIDFEDFMITSMPLYDYFTLVLSLPSSPVKPDNAAQAFTQYNIAARAEHIGIPGNTLRWHFLHHLLLRLGPWSTGEKRKPYRKWLMQVLNCFLAGQDNTL